MAKGKELSLAELEAKVKEEEAAERRREEQRKKQRERFKRLQEELAAAKVESLKKILDENGITEANQLQTILKFVDDNKPELLPKYAEAAQAEPAKTEKPAPTSTPNPANAEATESANTR